MKKSELIKEFRFNTASYEIGDGKNTGLLKIDYKNNQYNFDFPKGKLDVKLKKEIQNLALDLLKRKHGVNFANAGSN